MAECDGRLVGHVRSAHWTDAHGCLVQGQIGFVHPAWRRRGIGRVAGQVKPFINTEQNATQNRRRGEREFIGAGAPWRRRGLAGALIARALAAQRDAGMDESVLGVDADNAHDAARLYGRCGFRVAQRNMVVASPWGAEAPVWSVRRLA